VAEYISVEHDGAVALVTIDHPPVNALSAQLLDELEAEVVRMDEDESVRVAVLRGAGDPRVGGGAGGRGHQETRPGPTRGGGAPRGRRRLVGRGRALSPTPGGA